MATEEVRIMYGHGRKSPWRRVVGYSDSYVMLKGDGVFLRSLICDKRTVTNRPPRKRRGRRPVLCSVHGPNVLYDIDGRPHVCINCDGVYLLGVKQARIRGDSDDEQRDAGLAAVARRVRAFERKRQKAAARTLRKKRR